MKFVTHQHSPDNLVDTHVLVHHSLRHPGWLEQCLASMAGEPTNVELVYSDETSVGALRAAAFARGSAPFLSFIDDDDWVAPGAFQACLDAINDDSIVGAYTQWTDVFADGTHAARALPPWEAALGMDHFAHVLHTKVFRRAPTMRLLGGLRTWNTLEEAWLVGMLTADGNWRRVPVNGHFKRAGTPGGAGKRITSDHCHRYYTEIGPILRAARDRCIKEAA